MTKKCKVTTGDVVALQPWSQWSQSQSLLLLLVSVASGDVMRSIYPRP